MFCLIKIDFVHKCQSCGERFKQKSHLKTHFANVHNSKGSRKCIVCSKTYRQTNNFVVHYKKEHLNCGQQNCNKKKLCVACIKEISDVKNEWKSNLKPEEVCMHWKLQKTLNAIVIVVNCTLVTLISSFS